MLDCNLHETHIKKDAWVKSIRKTHNPEKLSDLIKKRIEFPGSTGPYIRQNLNETSTDIIDAFIADDEEYRTKLVPAIGLLIYKIMYGKMMESHEILRGCFSVIMESRLTECSNIVHSFLNQRFETIDKADPKWKQTYRDAMMAYAQIQSVKNKEAEEWWSNSWKNGLPILWPAAFLGLRIQNPDAACVELPLLMSRNLEKTAYLLVGMWHDKNVRAKMERYIRDGIDTNSGWSGLALNMLVEKLTKEDRDQLMSSLKSLGGSN